MRDALAHTRPMFSRERVVAGPTHFFAINPHTEGAERMSDDLVKQMVDRFLQWKLPEDFSPDAGISFKRHFNEHLTPPMRHEPVGTNLLNAMQAEEMVRYIAEAQSAEITRLREQLAEANARADLMFAAGIEAAAQTVEAYSEYDGQLCCNGHMCGCHGETVHGAILHYIHALTPPDITAAAARVLLAAWPTDTSFDAAFAACATAYHGGDQMQDTMDRTLATVSAALRALAEVKP